MRVPKQCWILEDDCPIEDECRFCQLYVVVNDFKEKARVKREGEDESNT